MCYNSGMAACPVYYNVGRRELSKLSKMTRHNIKYTFFATLICMEGGGLIHA